MVATETAQKVILSDLQNYQLERLEPHRYYLCPQNQP